MEALADALAVDLVGEVGKANVAHELFTNYGDGGDMGLPEGGLRAIRIAIVASGDVLGGDVGIRHLERCEGRRKEEQ